MTETHGLCRVGLEPPPSVTEIPVKSGRRWNGQLCRTYYHAHVQRVMSTLGSALLLSVSPFLHNGKAVEVVSGPFLPRLVCVVTADSWYRRIKLWAETSTRRTPTRLPPLLSFIARNKIHIYRARNTQYLILPITGKLQRHLAHKSNNNHSKRNHHNVEIIQCP